MNASLPPARPPGPVHVIGASGRSGLALVHALLDAGIDVVPVVRNAGRWQAAGIGLALPATLLAAGALLARPVPGLPSIGIAEIRRLLEDKAFDIGPMRSVLGIEPIALEEGLRRTFGGSLGQATS